MSYLLDWYSNVDCNTTTAGNVTTNVTMLTTSAMFDGVDLISVLLPIVSCAALIAIVRLSVVIARLRKNKVTVFFLCKLPACMQR